MFKGVQTSLRKSSNCLRQNYAFDRRILQTKDGKLRIIEKVAGGKLDFEIENSGLG